LNDTSPRRCGRAIQKQALEFFWDQVVACIIASTTAARGAGQFTDMEDALSAFLVTKNIVLNSAENVKTADLASTMLPFRNWWIGWID
jgi:hypothetical protein